MKYTIGHMQNKNRQIKLSTFFELLRWNKPTGRMILLIPAGWSLYLTPDANPTFLMIRRPPRSTHRGSSAASMCIRDSQYVLI